jgi:glycosyltransferase involved in cell wall biosynthesis
MGHKVFVITGSTTEQGTSLFRSDGIINYPLLKFENGYYRFLTGHQSSVSFAQLFKGVYFNPFNLIRIRQLKDIFDVVYIFNIAGISLSVCETGSTPTVFHIADLWPQVFFSPRPKLRNHDLPIFNPFFLLLKRITNKQNVKMISISRFVKRRLVETLSIPPTKIRTIPYGVDTKIFYPIKKEQSHDVFRIVYVGQLHHGKGIHVLLKALYVLIKLEPSTRFILDIIGDGDRSYINSLYKIIKELKLTNNVIFHGKIEHERLATYYNSGDVFVYPSVWNEAFGMSVLEAMACGVPVIASAVGGLPEIVTNLSTGLLFNPGDYMALSYALLRIYRDDKLRERLSSNGLAFAQKLTWEHISKCIEEVLLSSLC